MTANEFRELTTEELERKIEDIEEDQFRLRFSVGRAAEANPAEKRKARRDLARAKTLLRERQLKEQKA